MNITTNTQTVPIVKNIIVPWPHNPTDMSMQKLMLEVKKVLGYTPISLREAKSDELVAVRNIVVQAALRLDIATDDITTYFHLSEDELDAVSAISYSLLFENIYQALRFELHYDIAWDAELDCILTQQRAKEILCGLGYGYIQSHLFALKLRGESQKDFLVMYAETKNSEYYAKLNNKQTPL